MSRPTSAESSGGCVSAETCRPRIRLYQSVLPLARLDMHPKLIQFFKGALDRVGRFGGPTRPPRLALSQEEELMLDGAMRALKSASMA